MASFGALEPPYGGWLLAGEPGELRALIDTIELALNADSGRAHIRTLNEDGVSHFRVCVREPSTCPDCQGEGFVNPDPENPVLLRPCSRCTPGAQ